MPLIREHAVAGYTDGRHAPSCGQSVPAIDEIMITLRAPDGMEEQVVHGPWAEVPQISNTFPGLPGGMRQVLQPSCMSGEGPPSVCLYSFTRVSGNSLLE